MKLRHQLCNVSDSDWDAFASGSLLGSLLRRIIRNVMFATIVFLASSGESAWSQTAGQIKIVVPSTPGGTADVVARLLADQIGRVQRTTAVIENRPGAGTLIATELALHAAPDGSTVLIVAPPFLINPYVRKLDYDPLSSFEPICHLVRSPAILVVDSASPYRTLTDLLNAARTKPDELTLASTGPATATHIAFERLKRSAGINMTFIPYPGMAPVVNAVLGRHVTAAFGNYGDLIEQIKAGKLRALAAATRTRIKSLTDVPTFAESGYSNFEADVWYGLVAPATTPKTAISRLVEWITGALQVPEIRSKLAALGISVVGSCGADFATFLRKQYEDYGRTIHEADIKVE
jgi:tripartite-type tricarboxylate transporter receptor subunit TctC